MRSSLTVAINVVALACWLMSVYKVRDLVRDRSNKSLRALWFALIAITAALSAELYATEIDQLIGRAGSTRAIYDCLTLASAASAQAFLLYMTAEDTNARRRVRRRAITMLLCATTIAALFLLIPAPYPVTDPRFRSGSYYDTEPSISSAPYVIIYLAYLAWAMTQVVILSHRYARMASRSLLRFGLRLVRNGSVAGVIYAASKLTGFISSSMDRNPPMIVPLVTVMGFTTAILFILVGSTIPSWGPMIGLDRAFATAAILRDYRRLTPLWTDLREVVPTIELFPQSPGMLYLIALLRQPESRLVRRVVEIRDAYLQLRPHLDPRAARIARQRGTTAGLEGEQLEATVEAATIAAAVRAYRQPGPGPCSYGHAAPVLGFGNTEEDSHPSGEVAWLIQVTQAYARSPIVRATLDELAVPAQPVRI